ncbi:MAG TPA: 2-nitropropane dioxygenase [Lapillicoccus sp.]|nr:2-nitropropane dioxygenase [Lapillicoccus sp.]
MTTPSGAPPAETVPLPVRLALAHAALQVLAAETRVDLLHIKGVAADASIGEVVGPGSDADVLVRPEQVTRFLAELQRRGWQRYTDFESGSPFGHAATFFHDCWGFGDVHRHFPGIGIAADEAFELLWSGRTTASLAGVPGPVPSRAGQLLILVLNTARSGGASSRMELVRGLWDETPLEVRDEVTALASSLHAEVAFGAGLGELERYRGRREYLLWKVSSQGGTRLEEWAARIWAAPTLGRALHLAFRAPLVNTEHLALRIGHPPTRLEVLREFLARPYRGVVQEVGRLRRQRGRHTRTP